MALTIPTQGVIDDKMIRTSVISAIKQHYEERAAVRREREKKRGEEKKRPKIKYEQMDVDFEEVEVLSLSFKNLSRIDNLNGLRMLNTLKLDNNIIGNIENLDHLVNLTWLDLSFNNIKRITGLESLTKLTDLTLFNNSISTFSGLEGLTNLNVLSIGNNDINDVKEIRGLRQFSNLNVLNMDGNKVCEDTEYKMTVLAFLPSIRFFDYVLVEEKERINAKEQYQDDLQELDEQEKMVRESKASREKKEALLKRYEDANIDPITTLMDTMFQEDIDTQKLLDARLKGLDELKADYGERLSGLAEDVKGDGLKKYEEQQIELNAFNDMLKEARQKGQQKAIAAIRTYKEKETEVFNALRAKLEDYGDNDEDEYIEVKDSDFKTLKQDNMMCKKDLLRVESDLTDQCDLILNEFEARYGKLRAQSADIMEKYFRGAEDAENVYFEMVQELVNDLLEQMNNDTLEDVTDECRGLLADKEMLMTSIASAHDTHLSKLLSVEEELRERANQQTIVLLKRNKDNEWERNRNAIMDIRGIFNDHVKAMENFKREMNEDEGRDDEY